MPYHVLLTRPIEDSQHLAHILAQENIHSLHAPMMDIVFDPTLPFSSIPATAQACLFTSAYGVEALIRRTKKRLPSLTIGPHSAHRAKRHGFTPVTSGDGRRTSLLQQALRHMTPDAGSLYHPCATVHADKTTRMLTDYGFTIHSIPLYQAVPRTTLPHAVKDALCHNAIDAVLFFSARTAALFKVTLAQEDIPAQWMTSLHAFALNDSTATILRPLAFKAIHCAKRPTQHHMLESLRAHLKQETRHQCLTPRHQNAKEREK